jgi:hypothetical protein
MAAQPALAALYPAWGDRPTRWRAYHVFYHGDQDILLRRLVGPLTDELAGLGWIQEFYFVRYCLGGPHVRLRWSSTSEAHADAAEHLLARRVEQFFKLYPSLHPLPDDQVRSMNRNIIRHDPAATDSDNRCYGDNCWLPFPPEFEIERYGGPDHFEASLHFFCQSTESVLELLRENAGRPEGWKRGVWLRLLLRLALGFSSGDREWFDLLAYAADDENAAFSGCIREGDAAFAGRRNQLTVAARDARHSPGTGVYAALQRSAEELSRTVRSLPAARRRAVAGSHLHMTANRLGLWNAEEVYMSRIAWRAARDVRCGNTRYVGAGGK